MCTGKVNVYELLCELFRRSGGDDDADGAQIRGRSLRQYIFYSVIDGNRFKVQRFRKGCKEKTDFLFSFCAKVSSLHQTTSPSSSSSSHFPSAIISFSLPFGLSLFCDYESGSVFIWQFLAHTQKNTHAKASST